MSIRIGKLGIVRLTGKDMGALRTQCLSRDEHCCVKCGRWVMDDVPYWAFNKYDMAHKKNKRMYGDVLENVETMCHECHMKSHNAGGKPLPRKELQ